MENKKDFWTLMALILGSLLFGALMFLGLAALFHVFSAERPSPPAEVWKNAILRLKAPLEIDSGETYRRYRDQKEEELQRYRWIDPASGSVQIPIERAMRLLVERSQAAAPESQAGNAGKEREP
ncbi:MAG TPA: hypothetical protein DF383_06155 [Deltaproteobacteria bacterium]|nr:hypothetical protein [Deltaproteobacteria bacterium]